MTSRNRLTQATGVATAAVAGLSLVGSAATSAAPPEFPFRQVGTFTGPSTAAQGATIDVASGAVGTTFELTEFPGATYTATISPLGCRIVNTLLQQELGPDFVITEPLGFGIQPVGNTSPSMVTPLAYDGSPGAVTAAAEATSAVWDGTAVIPATLAPGDYELALYCDTYLFVAPITVTVPPPVTTLPPVTTTIPPAVTTVPPVTTTPAPNATVAPATTAVDPTGLLPATGNDGRTSTGLVLAIGALIAGLGLVFVSRRA
jgi:LPXTG-motif cell wall-anchored protein